MRRKLREYKMTDFARFRSGLATLLFVSLSAFNGHVSAQSSFYRENPYDPKPKQMKNTLIRLNGIAVIRSEQSSISGVLYFTQEFSGDAPVFINGSVNGLSAGDHGIHVHDFGNLTDYCHGVGYHFNADWHPHGGLQDKLRHNGDLGNIQNGDVNITSDRIALFGRDNIFGRSIVIHADADDYGKSDAPLSPHTGNSGDKIACGIIAKLDFVYSKDPNEKHKEHD